MNLFRPAWMMPAWVVIVSTALGAVVAWLLAADLPLVA
jgi:hypothetical protein